MTTAPIALGKYEANIWLDKNIKADYANKAINSLTAMDDHERPLFIELHGTVVSRRIFIRSQSLIAP